MIRLNSRAVLFMLLFACGVMQPVFAQTTVTAGDMEITSNLMTFHNNIYIARGGMTATQKDSVLTAERGIYDRTIEVVKAIDDVKVVQPGSVLTSDYLEAYLNEDRILARGNPKLVRIVERESRDESGEPVKNKTRVILTCNEVEGFNKENRFVAKGEVHVIEVPFREGETEEEALENEKNPVSDLVCEILELYSAEDKAIARNDVVIVNKNLRATGDRAIYLDKENRLIIVGHAHAIQTTRDTPDAQEQVSELFANKIIYYPDEDRTIAVGEVHATVYPQGSRPDEEPKDKKRKPRKKADSSKTAESEIKSGPPVGADPVQEADQPVPEQSPPADLPEGDYMPIGGDEYIEAVAE